MLVTASSLASGDDFCRAVLENTKGLIFLGTPHRGANLTLFGRFLSLFGYWTGSSTVLLDVLHPGSIQNDSLHQSFMECLPRSCTIKNTVCIFETVPETLLGFPVIQVSGLADGLGIFRETAYPAQVVDKYSAVIDGSYPIGFEQNHRSIQRFASTTDPNYRDIVRLIRTWAGKGAFPIGLSTLECADLWVNRETD